MTAVVCELVGRDDAAGRSLLTTLLPEMTQALVEGVRRGVEDPRIEGAPDRER